MKIAQLTDLHIAGAGESPYEIDVRANFLLALDNISSEQPDLLIISGDLCYETGEPKIYQWILEQLQALPYPWCAIPGNHDDGPLMAQCMGLEDCLHDGFFFFKQKEGQPPMIFMDSAVYEVSDANLKQLAGALPQVDGPLCLFIHHPPLEMGVPFMDRQHALRNPEPLLALLTEHPHPVHVFCGHYHVEKTAHYRNVNVYITPSCFFQIDWREESFAVDHRRPAYRLIEWDGVRLVTGVRYLDLDS